jgi:uncharacterized protein (TIGR02001 family)
MLMASVHLRTTFLAWRITMKKLPYLLALSGLITAPAMAADAPASPHTVSFNIGVTTDYVFRGISQSQHDPAISGGADYSHASGLYAGTWVSTQKWVSDSFPATPYKSSSDFEWDVYGGYKGSVGDLGYDIGIIHYAYDGKRAGLAAPTPETTEVYVGASWKFLSAKYSYVVSPYFIGWGTRGATKTDGSSYIELNANYDMGDGWGLIGHIGHQKVKNVGVASYSDWKIGVSKDVGFGVVTLAYSDTNADGDVGTGQPYDWNGEDAGKGTFALSFSKSF